jgi:hypothetical protein
MGAHRCRQRGSKLRGDIPIRAKPFLRQCRLPPFQCLHLLETFRQRRIHVPPAQLRPSISHPTRSLLSLLFWGFGFDRFHRRRRRSVSLLVHFVLLHPPTSPAHQSGRRSSERTVRERGKRERVGCGVRFFQTQTKPVLRSMKAHCEGPGEGVG